MTSTVAVAAPSGEDPPPVLGSLSPSRAGDFKTCPLLYRLRSIDRLPQKPSPEALRGTVVHGVLERLFDLPALERTEAAAAAMVEQQWQRVREAEPEVETLFGPEPDPDRIARWLDSARDLLRTYFTLEDPTRLEPAEREHRVEVVLDGLRLLGYVDRLDVSPAGDLRVIDFKTGASPREAFEGKALFQMKFYALVLWRTRGVVPRMLRLIYLADGDTLSYTPDEQELERFERTVRAIWDAIRRATEAQDFRPSPSRLCAWCDYHEFCPAQGGTTPPFPERPVSDSDHRHGRPEATSPGTAGEGGAPGESGAAGEGGAAGESGAAGEGGAASSSVAAAVGGQIAGEGPADLDRPL